MGTTRQRQFMSSSFSCNSEIPRTNNSDAKIHLKLQNIYSYLKKSCAGAGAQLSACLIPEPPKLGVVTHTRNPSIQGVEVGRSN